MMTWKSFTDLDMLFNLLIERYQLEPPEGLKLPEVDEWKKLKQHIVRTRYAQPRFSYSVVSSHFHSVFNTFKTLVMDEDGVLEEEDQYIFTKIKQFLNGDDVKGQAAAKQCLMWLERVERDEGLQRHVVHTQQTPIPIIPRLLGKKMKILDIDPTELARQLTLMESQLYMKIRPMECILRSREQRSGKLDHIPAIIQTSNQVCACHTNQQQT